MGAIRVPNLHGIDPIFMPSQRETIALAKVPDFDSSIHTPTRKHIRIEC